MSEAAAKPDDLIAGALSARHDPQREAEFDITAMIDLVFMMNIYFLVTFIGAASQEVNLPTAMHCAPLDGEVATVITVVAGPDAQTVNVYVGDSAKGTALTDPDQQAEKIAEAVDRGTAEGKTAVLIKAEKNVRLREMGRLAAAAAKEGVTLHLGVVEKDVAE
jgi:biopolymer transport protein ExbD